jgi:UDP-N-acetylmuramoyl-tripeptide--D-alanyl-D-alanine ligase
MNRNLTTAFVAREMRQRGYQVVAGPSMAVTGGAADSRTVRPGDLFTAFHGEHTDGNGYVADALTNGAVAAVCERPPGGEWPGKTVVVAPDALKAIGELAAAWLRRCSPRVVAITGTVGKTTAKDLTAAAVAAVFVTHKSEGNLNSREGLPLAVMSLRTDDEVSVLEMAMDSKGEILELCEIARPEVGVVLNVGLTHISKLGSIAAIQAEKLSLPRYLPPGGTAVLNFDDPRVGPAASELRCRVITFGEGKGATLQRGPITDHRWGGTSFPATYEGETRAVRSPLPGEHLVPAALSALGVCLALGLSFETAVAAIGEAHVEGRIRVVTGLTGATIIDDRYNSSPASLTGALRMLRRQSGRRIALLGKMAELGPYEDEEHRRAGRLAAQCCDIVVGFGDVCQVLVEAVRVEGMADVHWFASREEAAARVLALLRPDDVLLVKGSRSEALEAVMPLLEGAK